jgi:C_GCAxxG_C_C family probable redox protein
MVDADGTVDSSIATGFGGGLGTNGLVCGAVAAGTMIIGLQQKGKEKKEVYQQVDTFLSAFRSHFGALNCRELLGVDLKTEEGMHYLKAEGREKCREFVRYVADNLGERLKPLSNNKA